MRHRKRGRKLGHSSSHKLSVGRNILRSLFEHGSIVTTVAKAKEFAPYADKIITIAKRAEAKAKALGEKLKDAAKDKLTPEVQADIDKQCASVRVAHIRRIFAVLRDRTLVQRVYYDICPAYTNRSGGYTQVLRLNKRRVCDDAPRAVLKLVEEIPVSKERTKTKEEIKAERENQKKEREEKQRKMKERKEREKERQKERKDKEKERLRKEREIKSQEAAQKKEKKEKKKK